MADEVWQIKVLLLITTPAKTKSEVGSAEEGEEGHLIEETLVKLLMTRQSQSGVFLVAVCI